MRTSTVIIIALVALFIALPVAAAPLGVGMFSGASSHKMSGSVTVTKQDGQYVIELGGDFSFDGAPDPYVALLETFPAWSRMSAPGGKADLNFGRREVRS